MPTISVLDQNTINKIAAGEVIERPASVVKELLENAVDARATAITVEIREGGCQLIRVTDNGCGIPKEQIPVAFLRHATSKIQTVEDLTTISSLGFRGEALASIASVAQVEMISKTSDSLTGTRYQIDGGAERTLEEVGAPEGTTILVRNLFYNTPARKKFLKTPMTEGSHVAGLVEKIALSHPGVSIRFIQNNQNKLYTSGNHNLKDLIYTVYGREVAGSLLAVEQTEAGISAAGYIGKPVIARSNRNYENYFINGRYVKSGIIAKAIEEAYKPFMMQHKYPFTMLHFTIDPAALDVNVHPTKMELRFSDSELVYRTVLHAVKEALAHKELIPEVSLSEEAKEAAAVTPRPEPFETHRRQSLAAASVPSNPWEKARAEAAAAQSGEGTAPQRPKAPAAPPQPEEAAVSAAAPRPEAAAASAQEGPAGPSYVQEEQAGYQTQKPEAEQLELFDDAFLTAKARSRHRLIGQLFDTYWMVEYKDSLFIIDQHAAHEKVLYEKTVATLKTRQYDTQMVEPPIILTLSMNEAQLLEKYKSYFTGIGFEIEPFGGREYAVRGIPANLFSIAKRELLLEMIDGLSDETEAARPELIYEKIASMSCKAAVKGRHTMTFAEADELIDQLLRLENPYACPHGRPTIISMSRYELEKKFKRIVS